MLTECTVGIHRFLIDNQQLLTVAAELVERACLNQTLYHALGAFRRIDAAAEVEDVAVYAVFAFADDGFYCILPNGFDGTKTEENA